MFNEISDNYDLLNRILSFGLDGVCRKRAVSGHENDDLVLDICSGTGDMTIELLRLNGFKGTAVLGDFSRPMQKIARRKVGDLLVDKTGRNPWGGPEIFFVYCDAENLPFKNEVFDGILSGYSLRNLGNLQTFGSEIGRVLRVDGHMSLVDVAHPPDKLAARLFYLYFYKLVPLISRLFTRKRYAYRYLPASLRTFLKQDEVVNALKGDHLKGRYQNILKGAVAIYRLWK